MIRFLDVRLQRATDQEFAFRARLKQFAGKHLFLNKPRDQDFAVGVPVQFTTLQGRPAMNARTFPTATSSNLWRAAWVAHATCGVTRQLRA